MTLLWQSRPCYFVVFRENDNNALPWSHPSYLDPKKFLHCFLKLQFFLWKHPNINQKEMLWCYTTVAYNDCTSWYNTLLACTFKLAYQKIWIFLLCDPKLWLLFIVSHVQTTFIAAGINKTKLVKAIFSIWCLSQWNDLHFNISNNKYFWE